MMAHSTPKDPSTSRQKSCHACVKGKRGCDKRLPVCSRCEEKNIQCVYAKRTYAEAFYDFDSTEPGSSWADSTALLSSVDLVDDIAYNVASAASLDPSHLSILGATNDPFLTSAENQAMPPSDMQFMNNTRNMHGQQQENEQTISTFDYAPMADICIRYEPWQVYDPNSKAHFIVQVLKGYPSTFAKSNSTPWMHESLYKDQMPSSIRTCFTVSTLYSNVTNSNKTSVFRVLCQSLSELKRQQMANTPQEKLAQVQALFLYQIIGLFDGDVTLRSNADRNMPLLQGWLDELCKIRETLRTPDNMNDPSPPKSWEWWIFSESVRRTIIIAYAFLGLWSIMSNDDDDAIFSAWEYLHCWTMSRPLWEASSSFDFFRAWKAYHIIQNFEFEDFLEDGRADDVDEFAKVLMVTYMGLDETKEWFMKNGCVF